ncbi:MAG: copper resistance protein NlpE [Methylococcaceae bacterium]
MQALKKQLKQNLALIFFGTLLSAYHPAMAKTDLEAQQSYLKARVMSHQQETDHSAHVAPIDKSQDFHGVFYGFIPCNDCNGIKTTLSLKQNNNYLLVTQPAREASREFYEKGKYTWDDEKQAVVLTPHKEEAAPRQYYIENEGTLIQLNSDGGRMPRELTDSYTLRRSDTVKSREVHIH